MQHSGKPMILFSRKKVQVNIISLYFINIIIVDISNEEEVDHEAQDASFANHSESTKELDLIYGRKLHSPILGYHCQFPDLPTSCIPSITLDTSLLHVRFNDMHSICRDYTKYSNFISVFLIVLPLTIYRQLS